LAIGANTYVLTSNGTTASWAAPSGGGSGTVNSGTAYQLAYYAASGTAVSTLGSLGTSGQVLTSGGAGVAPSWTTITGGASNATPTSYGLVLGMTDTTVSYATALGNSAHKNITGQYNTATGYQALQGASPYTANRNDAYGYLSLGVITTGSYNTAYGFLSASALTTGTYNTAIGNNALASNTTASYNTAVGYQAGYTSTTGYITAIGYQAGKAYNGVDVGASTFVGYGAGLVTTGIDNTFIGWSGIANTSGAQNTAVGSGALRSNTTANFNTAVGYQALYSNTTSSNSVAVGGYALNSLTGAQVTAVGHQAGSAATTATASTYLGYQTGNGVTTGSYNTLIGYNMGFYTGGGASALTTGNFNTLIGYSCGASSASVSNELLISTNYGYVGKGANTGFITPSGGGVYQGNNSATWSVTSDQRLKKNIVDNNVGLDAVNQIRVRNFEYRTENEVTDLPIHSVIKKEGVQLGVIAQELQQILPDCVKVESTGVMSVNSDNIMWHMINAIKELNAKVIQLESKLGA
jgi:hypothetical protein